MNDKARKIVLWAAVVFVVVSLGYVAYGHFFPRPAGSKSVEAEVAPAVKRAPTARVAIKAPVKVYQGKSKVNLKLPAALIADDREQVIAATQVKPELRAQTVSTVVNTETGVTQTLVKTDPYPWLALEGRGEARVLYGYKIDGATHDVRRVLRVQLGYDVVRVKALTAGVLVSLDSDRQAFAGVGIAYRW